MLNIRADQIAAFREARWEDFAHELLARARDEMPEICAAQHEEESLQVLRIATRRAASLGILLTADVARYALLALRLGSDPATDDGAIGAAAHDAALVGRAKVDAIARAAGL
ncbi:MAG: hypothetical protein ACXW31_06835 [Thermoanaerobaculia bacterium]